MLAVYHPSCDFVQCFLDFSYIWNSSLDRGKEGIQNEILPFYHIREINIYLFYYGI
jgi:hypothetical protein